MVAHPDPAKHWRIRRYTMFVSFATLVFLTIGFALIGLKSPEALSSMGVLIGWVYGTLSLPIIGYFGNTAVEEYVKNRKQ